MEKTINVFGDSIVYAGYINGNGWVDYLRKYLEKDSKNYFEVYNLGITGETSVGLLNRFDIENESRNPDVVIIGIGANDSCYLQSKNDNYVSLEKFEENLKELINKTRRLTQEIIFVGFAKSDESMVTPAPWATDFYYKNKNIEIYNNKIKEVCENNNIHFIEMLDLLENEDLEDGLHPNSAGHEKMFLRIKDYLVENKII